MTKTEALKKFFKKFFDIDAHGWGTVSVLNDVIENNESLDGGGSSFDLSDRIARGVTDSGIVVNGAVVEGAINTNKATGINAHAEGKDATASGWSSHAEGAGTKANASCSHAEGDTTTANASGSHAEGSTTTASGNDSHAEGYHTIASGGNSHAEGKDTTASGHFSHAEGNGTIAQGVSQHVIGEYNVAQGTINNRIDSDYVFIVGNGTKNNNRSNAFAMKWDGTFVFANGTEITPAQFASLLALLNQ